MTADTQAPAPAPAPTADMVLVPREPTPEMKEAWFQACDVPVWEWADSYRAMLAASPTPSPGPADAHRALGHLYGIASSIASVGPDIASDIRHHADTIMWAMTSPSPASVTPLAGEAGAVEALRADEDIIASTLAEIDGRDYIYPADMDAAEKIASALASLTPPKAETETASGETVAVPYDDFHAAYRHVPRSRMHPDDCLKSRLRSLLRSEDVAHADEAEGYATTPTEAASERERLVEALGLMQAFIKRYARHDGSCLTGRDGDYGYASCECGFNHDRLRFRAALAQEPAR